MYRLLIVDDEPLIRSFMKDNLQKIHPEWEVCGEASDGAEALDYLSHNKADLVLTDIKMPVMNGLELCREISLNYPGQRMIILSGYDEFAFAQEAMKYGVQGYLLKPINKLDFNNLLSETINKIEEETEKEWTYKSLTGLSLEYQRQVTCNYLRAVISNTSTEIKVLHPLLYKMKINLIEAVCTIMVLKLDIESALYLKIPVGDLTVYNYILHQATKETVEEKFGGYVFTDSMDRITVYVSGHDNSELQQICLSVFNEVSAFMRSHTRLTVSGFAGQHRTDVLEINGSYTEALNLIPEYAAAGGDTLYPYQKKSNDITIKAAQLEKTCAALSTTCSHMQEPSFYEALSDYIIQIKPLDALSALRFAIFLLDCIRRISPNESQNRFESAIKYLMDYLANLKELTHKELINHFAEAIKIYVHEQEAPNESEAQSLAESTRDYILNHYAEPLSLAQIADNFGVSAGYLSKVFHEAFGETYIKFLIRTRMEQAARLLKANPQANILQIAEKTGYINPKHFCYVFKQYFNKTASDYQKGG